jgi:hypothetical protein
MSKHIPLQLSTTSSTTTTFIYSTLTFPEGGANKEPEIYLPLLELKESSNEVTKETCKGKEKVKETVVQVVGHAKLHKEKHSGKEKREQTEKGFPKKRITKKMRLASCKYLCIISCLSSTSSNYRMKK